MADEFETFEIDDSFDPLEDLAMPEEPDASSASDYQMPGEDAETHVAAVEPELPPRERIAQLIERMPGQKARLLEVVAFCEEPRTLAEVSDHLAAAFPSDVSVYGPDRLVALLAHAGALAGSGGADEADDAGADSEAAVAPCDGGEPSEDEGPGEAGVAFLAVEPAAPRVYKATEEGMAFAGDGARVQEVAGLAAVDGGRYAPLYREILELASREGGCPVKEINAAIDPNPLCEEPRRFATYFLHEMEKAGGVVWDGAWRITDHGRTALESGAFAE